MKLLEGKTALVTGGSRGIGKAVVLKFAEQGANVVFTCTKLTDNTASLEKEASAFGVTVKAVASNVGSFEESTKLIEDTVKEFGRIDVLVNNAGIARDNLLMRMSEQQWDDIMNINLKSVFNMTKAIQRTLLKQRSGSIINMSSVVGVSGNAGQSNYAASKAGVIGFTKSIAKELGSRNIRCNAIAPGFIVTDMTADLSEEMKAEWAKTIPLKRGGTPEDVADTTLFLASDLSTYVSGQVINVCGAMNT